jgi:hypothetical protein
VRQISLRQIFSRCTFTGTSLIVRDTTLSRHHIWIQTACTEHVSTKSIWHISGKFHVRAFSVVQFNFKLPVLLRLSSILSAYSKHSFMLFGNSMCIQGKLNLICSLIMHHAVTVYGKTAGAAPRIRNLDNRWKCGHLQSQAALTRGE